MVYYKQILKFGAKVCLFASGCMLGYKNSDTLARFQEYIISSMLDDENKSDLRLRSEGDLIKRIESLSQLSTFSPNLFAQYSNNLKNDCEVTNEN